MITISNYSDQVKNIDWSKLPSNVKEAREGIEDIMEFYNDDDGIKETIDLYFKQINKTVSSQPKQKAKINIDDFKKSFKKEGKAFFRLPDERQYEFEKWLETQNFDYGDTSQTGDDIVFYDKDRFDSSLRSVKTQKKPSEEPIDTSILTKYAFLPKHPLMVLDKKSPQFRPAFDAFLKEVEKYRDKSPKGDWELLKPETAEELYFLKTLWPGDKKYKASFVAEGGVVTQVDKLVYAGRYKEPEVKRMADIIREDMPNMVFKFESVKSGKVIEKSVETKKEPTPKKTVAKTIDATIVDNFSNEFKLIRRAYNMVSKKDIAPFRTVQLLYMAFQKAAVGRSVRKTSDAADLFTKVNKKIVSLFNIAKPNQDDLDIDFKDKALLKEMEEFSTGKKVNYAITLLNSFIGMQGTKPDVKKAQNLWKRIDNAIKKGNIDKDNRLWPDIKTAEKELKDYIEKPSEKIEADLHGLSLPIRRLCTNRVKCEGLKNTGRLKQGYKFVKGGTVVKIGKTKKRPSPTTKKKKIIQKKDSKRQIKQLGTVLIDVSTPTPPAVVAVEGATTAAPLGIQVQQDSNVIDAPNKSVAQKPTNEGSALGKLKKLGFVMANEAPSTPNNIFVLPGEIGRFLQSRQPHKELILIKGTKHTSKSQLAMQIANAYGEMGKLVCYIDYEQGGLESKDTINSLKWNTTPEGKKNIAIIGELENPFEDLKEFCKYSKVIIADSVTDLKISADQLNELRNQFMDVSWIFISQVKENGVMYGGNKMAHNPTCIIKCHPSNDPQKRYATLEKNRGNDLNLAYSIFSKTLIDVEQFTATSSIPSEMII